ncbi:DUF1707 SHOCT-like domain-containing protein [Granulicoccus sp. GXG6511]|uniref:DUF1707 SHOCT-like domain-containing protein n=1 Tax=Granulicoccus sp. GXG6511 TaxID=3381351 RepID=UPI003D7E534E
MDTPAHPGQPESVWTRFAVDPRASGDLRAGDVDRETARDVISEAYAQGQLTHEEYTERLGDALQANHLGQLVPLLNDIQVSRAPGVVAAQPPGRPPAPQQAPGTFAGLALPPSGVTRTALFVVGVTNLVWVWTSLSDGTLGYYWPMWPALGMAILVLTTMVFGGQEKRQDREIQRQERQRRRELE